MKDTLSHLVGTFVEPIKTMGEIQKNRSSFWAPLLVTVGVGIAFWFWFYLTIDYEWLRDYIITSSNPEATAEQREAMSSLLTRDLQMWSTVVSVVVVLLAIYSLQAAYLLVVAKVQEDDKSTFVEWFNVVSWAYFPKVIVTILAAITYLLAPNNQVSPTELNPVSLNSLFFQLPSENKWARLLESVDLLTFWTLFLLGVGFSIKMNVSRLKGALVAVAPYVFIYGVWVTMRLMAGE